MAKTRIVSMQDAIYVDCLSMDYLRTFLSRDSCLPTNQTPRTGAGPRVETFSIVREVYFSVADFFTTNLPISEFCEEFGISSNLEYLPESAIAFVASHLVEFDSSFQFVRYHLFFRMNIFNLRMKLICMSLFEFIPN
jgi:hypothetical protein